MAHTNIFIELDGRDIRSLNLRWMRKQIAYINQEPMLFDTTIFENIRYGLPEEGFSKEELHSLVITAAKQANAHDFIMALPQGYETEIGERGLQLSGGQRQRLTIARAIVSAPKILLLDEATSALDAMSESIVQNALESASKGRTTIIIAHRLSTVKRADNIIVMSGGSVVEQGTHYDLMTRNGIYAGMVEKQIGSDEKQEEDNSENDSKSDTRSKDEAKSNVEVTEQAIARDPSNEYSRRSDLPGLSLYELMKLVSRLLSQEWWIISMGLFFSTLVGLGTPAYVLSSFLFSFYWLASSFY
jgi:ATP-binding cassette subfamily B (MDR/TAP) protein 1